MKNEILRFIALFRSGKGMFLDGLCYWFSHILLHRFGCGEIIYDFQRGHFMWKHYDFAYDADGEHEIPTHSKTLESIKQDDPLWYERLLRDCVCKK